MKHFVACRIRVGYAHFTGYIKCITIIKSKF